MFHSWSNAYYIRSQSSVEYLVNMLSIIQQLVKIQYFEILFNLGNVYIYELLNANSNIHSFYYIKRDLKAKINFLECAGLKRVIQERQELLQAFIRSPCQ